MLYKQQSLRSIQLHQLEGGRPDKVIFESWYDGPYTMVPETQNGTFTNLAADAIRYLKGVGQNLDLLCKANGETDFSGGLIYQTAPSGTQVREWRSPANVGSQSFAVRMTNRGTVDDLRLHGRALSAAELVTLAARSDSPPAITPPGSQTLAAGATSAALPVTVNDVENGPDTLVLTATSSDESILPNANIAIGGSGSDRTVTLTPVAWAGGTVTVHLTVTDGLTVTLADFNLTVTNSGYSAQWTATGTAAPLSWTTASHWSQSQPAFPGNACEIDFLTGSTVPEGIHVSRQERASPFAARRLTLGGNSTTGATVRIDGNPLSLVNNGTGTPALALNADAPLVYRIDAPLQFGANANISGNGSATFEIASAWGGTAGIVKSGNSTIVLSGNNTFTGFTEIMSGAIRLAHGNALGAANSNTRVQGGNNLATLELSGGISVAEPLRLIMHNTAGHSQVRNVSGDNTLTATINLEAGGGRWDIASLAGSLAITGDIANVSTGSDTWRTLHLRGPANGGISCGISDSATSRVNLTVLSGEWTLSGDPKTYAGSTRIEGGTLRVETSLASPVNVVSGTLHGSGGSTSGNLAHHPCCRRRFARQREPGLGHFGNRRFHRGRQLDAANHAHRAAARLSARSLSDMEQRLLLEQRGFIRGRRP